jgi:uncharacterized membrane protein
MLWHYFILVLCLVAVPMMTLDLWRLWKRKDKESGYTLRYLVLALLLVVYLGKSAFDAVYGSWGF